MGSFYCLFKVFYSLKLYLNLIILPGFFYFRSSYNWNKIHEGSYFVYQQEICVVHLNCFLETEFLEIFTVVGNLSSNECLF